MQSKIGLKSGNFVLRKWNSDFGSGNFFWRRNSVSKNANCVLRNDYDRYEIPVSLNNLFGKKRNVYLCTELEKRHPCFNNDFCMDYIVKLRDRKLVFDVIVMNKIKYLEYKRKTKKRAFGLCFDDSLLAIRFANKNFLRLILIIFVAICLILFLSVRNISMDEFGVDESNENIGIVDSNIDLQNGKMNLSQNSVNFVYEDFFQKTKEKKGKILNFTWNMDGYFEEINCEVMELFPENYNDVFENLKTNVEYVDGIPLFTIDFKKKSLITLCDSKTTDVFDFSGIRNVLMNCKFDLINENTNPFSLTFYCNSDFHNFEQLGEFLKEKDICIVGIKILTSDNKKRSIELRFNEKLSWKDGFDINLLYEYKNLFERNNSEVNRIKNERNEIKKEIRYGQKVGAINYENGKKLIFYKDEKGKVIKILED